MENFQKITLKHILYFAFGAVLFFGTIVAAMAVEYDNVDEITIAPGQILESYLVLENFSGEGVASTQKNKFISFDGFYTYEFFDAKKITDSTYSLRYTIEIPSNTEIGPYTQEIAITENNKTIFIPVKINVQGEAFTKATNFFNSNASIGKFKFGIGAGILLILIIATSLIMIITNKQSGGASMPRNKYSVFLILLIIFAIIMSTFFVLLETNLIFKQKGSTFESKIDIDKEINGEVGTGYIRLLRNTETPSALDMVAFEDGKNVNFFSITTSEQLSKKLRINVPEVIESGVYYYDIEIIINQKSFLLTKSFRIA
jgi:hypothetical protein